MEIKTESINANDLDLINAWTLTPLSESDVFLFSAKLIDDEPTSNDRVWSREWQEANVDKFLGAPVTINHDTSDANLVVGRVYSATTEGNSIVGKVFVPLLTESGKSAANKIKSGQLKSMSINSKSKKSKKQKREGGADVDVILPDPDDRILEVSFVTAPGCASCGVLTAECGCGRGGKPKTPSLQESAVDAGLAKLGAEYLNELRAEYVRLSSFALGTSIDKTTYQKLAEQCDVATLKEVVADLRKASPRETAEAASEDGADSIKSTLDNIRKVKGA